MSPSPNIGGRVPPVPYGSTPLSTTSIGVYKSYKLYKIIIGLIYAYLLQIHNSVTDRAMHGAYRP